MDDGLILPRGARLGFSEPEVFNLMAGLEHLTDERLATILCVVLGEVHDRHGPGKCLQTVSLLLGQLERSGTK